jgi:hypothetical protein
MESEQPRGGPGELEPATAGQFTGANGPEVAAAWEEVAAGRYMPRRIKGSCKGRALG